MHFISANRDFECEDVNQAIEILKEKGYIIEDVIDKAEKQALENLEVAISHHNDIVGVGNYGRLTGEQATNIIKDMVIKLRKEQNG